MIRFVFNLHAWRQHLGGWRGVDAALLQSHHARKACGGEPRLPWLPQLPCTPQRHAFSLPVSAQLQLGGLRSPVDAGEACTGLSDRAQIMPQASRR